MQAFLWILIAVIAVVVVWMVMKSNTAVPPVTAVAPNGQPVPLGTAGNPVAAGGDAGTAAAVAGAVAAAFGFIGSIVNASNASQRK